MCANTVRITLFVSCLFFISPGILAESSSKVQPFETIKFGCQYLSNTNRNEFHEYWNPGAGYEGFVESPFYYGSIQAGLHVLPYSGKSEYIPDFWSIFYFLNWGKEFNLPLNFALYNSIRLGSYVIYVKENRRSGIEDEVFESELCFGFSSRLSYSPYKNWNLNLSGSYAVVYSNKRIKLFFVALGLSRTFNTPNWLREVLR